MWVTDPKTGEKSVTITLLVAGFSICCLKLLLSGVTIDGITLSPFSGVDFGAAVGALGAMYAARKHTDKSKDTE